MPTTSIQWRHLEQKPRSNYRQLFIKGTRIRARSVVSGYFSVEEPQTAEKIALDYRLPVEAVREAIAYVESKPIEIEQDFQYEEGMIRAAGYYEPGSNGQLTRRVSPEEEDLIYRQAYGEPRWR